MRDVIKLCMYEFRIQMTSKRVWLGYLVGITILLKQVVSYVQYADSLQEPIHVLEPFIVVGNCDRTIMFMVIGWLLVLSETPFINRSSMYVLCRTKRVLWSKAMQLYIVLQAVVYYGILTVVSMLLSCKNGYMANIWSQPFVQIESKIGDFLRYNIDFPSSDFSQMNSLYVGFLLTFSLQVLYAVVIGMLLYVVSQLVGQKLGLISTAVFHYLGYEILKDGCGITITYSLLARTIPAFQIGMEALENLLQSYLIFILIIVALVELSKRLVKYVDFKTNTVEGD